MKTLTDFRKTVETAVWHESSLVPARTNCWYFVKVEFQVVFDRP